MGLDYYNYNHNYKTGQKQKGKEIEARTRLWHRPSARVKKKVEQIKSSVDLGRR